MNSTPVDGDLCGIIICARGVGDVVEENGSHGLAIFVDGVAGGKLTAAVGTDVDDLRLVGRTDEFRDDKSRVEGCTNGPLGAASDEATRRRSERLNSKKRQVNIAIFFGRKNISCIIEGVLSTNMHKSRSIVIHSQSKGSIN